MPLPYGQIYDEWTRSKAFGDPRSINDYATDMNTRTGTRDYDVAAKAGPWIKASGALDSTIKSFMEPAMEENSNFLNRDKHPILHDIVGGAPRFAAEIAPSVFGGPVGMGATAALMGAHTYGETGSPKAALVSGGTALAIPAAGHFLGGFAARLAGAPVLDAAAQGVTTASKLTLPETFGQRTAQFAGSQVGMIGTNVAGSALQSHVLGEHFDLSSPSFWAQQIPWTAFDAVKMALPARVAARDFARPEPLATQVKPPTPTFTPSEGTVEKQQQVSQMFARFDAAQKAGASPEALSEMLVNVVNTIGKEPEKGTAVSTTAPPVDPNISLSGRAEKQGKNWKMEVADQQGDVPFPLPEHKNVWINSENEPKLDAVSGQHIWSGKLSELSDLVKVPLAQPKSVDTAQQELTPAINPQGTEPQFVAPEHVDEFAEANAELERASAREQKATANANNDLTVAEILPSIVPPDVAKPAIEQEMSEHKATPEQAVQSVVLQTHTPVVEEAQVTQKAAKATAENLLAKAQRGEKLTQKEVNTLALSGDEKAFAVDKKGRPSLSSGESLEKDETGKPVYYKKQTDALQALKEFVITHPELADQAEVAQRGSMAKGTEQFYIGQRYGKTKPLFEETQKEGIQTQAETDVEPIVDDPTVVKPNELPAETKNIAGRTILEAALHNVKEFGRGAGLSDPLETAKLLGRTKILMSTGAADRETLNAALVKANIKPFATDEEYKQFLLRASRGLNAFRSLYSDPSLGHIEPRDETLFRDMQVEQRGARGMIEWLGRQPLKDVPTEWHPLVALSQDLIRALPEVDDPQTTYPGHPEHDGYLGDSYHHEEQIRPTIAIGHLPTDYVDALITALKATHEMAHHATRELANRNDPAALEFKDTLETVRQALLKASPKAVQKIVNESLKQGLYEKYSDSKMPALSAGKGWIWGVGDYDSTTNRLNNKVTLTKDGTLALKVFQDRGGVGGRPLTKDEVELQKALVPEAFDSKGNVNVPTLFRELAKRQPVVETHTYGQEGKPSEAKAELDKMTHEWLETDRKLVPLVDSLEGGTKEGDLLHVGYSQDQLDKAKQYVALKQKVSSEPPDTSPRATSYYNQISPYDTKQFPVTRVDVAIPFEPGATKQGEGGLLWREDRLHENLPNTLGWAMVQFVPDPKTGETVAFVGEQQSRWGQERQKLEKKALPIIESAEKLPQGYSLEQNVDGNWRVIKDNQVASRAWPTKEKVIQEWNEHAKAINESTPDHPLLSIQHLLVLKAVIAEAAKRGVTKVVLSDGETAMMTEGHDQQRSNAVDSDRGRPNTYFAVDDPQHRLFATSQDAYEFAKTLPQGEPSQSGGMRLHYDTTLPSAMKKLTGSEGEAWEGGVHKNARDEGRDEAPDFDRPGDAGDVVGSPVFRNADGTPKSSVTGRAYDISEAVAKMNAQGGAFTLTGKAMSTPFNIRSEWAKIGGTTGEATVRQHSDLIYALHNRDELLAQIFNAPDVVQRLSDLQMPRATKRSLLQVFTDAWRKLFGGAETSGSALGQLLHGFGNYLSTGKDVSFDAEAFMRDVLLAKGVKPEALASRINTIRNVFTTGKLDASVRGFDNEGKRGMLPPTLQAKYPERLASPAVQSPDGQVFTNFMGHGPAASDASLKLGAVDLQDGYTTNKGRFVSREEGTQIAPANTPSAVHPALLTDLLTGAPRDVYASTINLLADELPLHQELLHRMAEDVYLAQRIRQEIKAGRAPGKLPDNEESLRLASANINAMRRAMDKQMLALDRFNSLNQFTEEGWEQSTLSGATGQRLPALPADRTGHESDARTALGAEYRGDETGFFKRYFWPTQFLKQQIPAARDAFNHIDDAQSQQNVRRNELNLQLGWNNATGSYDRTLADNYVRVRSTEGLQKVGSNVLRRVQELEAQNKPWMQDATVQTQLSRLSPNDRKAVTDAINSLRNRKADWNQKLAPESLTKDNLYHTAQVLMLREGTLDKGQAVQLSTDLYNALRDLRDPQTAVQGTQGLAVLRDKVSPDTFMAVLTHANTRINNSDKWLQFMQSRPTWVTEQRKQPHLLQMTDANGQPWASSYATRDAAIVAQREKLQQGFSNPRYTERPAAEVRGTIEESVLQSMREMDVRNEQAMQQAFADRPELVPQIQPFINRVDEYQNALAAGNPVPGPRVAKRAFRGGREELNMFEQDDRFFQGANNYLKSKLMDGVVGLDLLDPQLRGNTQATALVRQHLSNVKGFDNPWVRKLNEFTYFKNLGFNFGVNFLHAIQSLTTGMTAVIEETGGVGDAMKLTTKATKEVVQRYTTGKWSSPDLEYVAGRLQAQGGAGILAHDDFIDHDRDSMMLLNSQNPVGKAIDKVQGAARNWTNMFARHNDTVGTIAGFMLGKERGMSNEDAFQLGWDMKQRGYYSAGKAGRAVDGWSAKTRAVPQLMWSLQNYTASWFAQLGNNWSKGFSTKELGMSPVQIAGARKAFFYQLAAQGVLAGALGLPGVGQGLALFKQVTGNDAKDWLKKNLANMFDEDEVNGGFMTTLALHGGMAGATPIDVSSKHVPSFPFTGVQPRNGFSLDNLIPAPLTTASDVVKGLIAAAKGGDVTPALPHVLQQPFQLLANDGALKDQYGTYQLSPAEQFVTALGMKPSRVQQTQDAAKLVADTQKNAAAARAKEAQEVAELFRSGDGVAAQQKLAEWQQRNPTEDHAGFVRAVAGQVAQSSAPARTFDYTGNRIPNEANRLQATTGAMSALGIPRLPNLGATMNAEATDRLIQSNPYLSPSEARRDATSGTRPGRSPFGW